MVVDFSLYEVIYITQPIYILFRLMKETFYQWIIQQVDIITGRNSDENVDSDTNLLFYISGFLTSHKNKNLFQPDAIICSWAPAFE